MGSHGSFFRAASLDWCPKGDSWIGRRKLALCQLPRSNAMERNGEPKLPAATRLVGPAEQIHAPRTLSVACACVHCTAGPLKLAARCPSQLC
jgi:hypothetical protein